jgi:2-polyprenyl-6-methoxyphenol hydroxylase-like FAD-dependent oxidoreductase
MVPGSRAVVIGGSMAGLLAAHALADTFEHVTIVERDRLGASPAHRAGVPQDRHVHTLWAGGLRAVETLLPGIESDLVAAGGRNVDFWRDFRWYLPVGRWSKPWPATQHLVSSTRTLLESVVRLRVRDAGRVTFLDGCEATGLRLGPDGIVAGVEFTARGLARADAALDGEKDAEKPATEQLAADLVVDAAGRRSRLPEWLAGLGRKAPAETVVDPFIGYATRLVRLAPDRPVDFNGLYIQLAPPRHTRGGIMFPVEDGQWVVTLLGAERDYPPVDDDGFLEFARSMRSPRLYEAIRDAEPTTPLFGHRHTADQRRHYERMPSMPAGLLALGDSLCAFNPIYGQGMTVAALQAQTLGELFRRRLRARSETAALTRPAQAAMAKVAARAWMVSASEDRRYPVTGNPGPAIRALHGYLDRVMLACTVDVKVADGFLRVLNMLDKPTALQRPDFMLRVFGAARRARRTAGVDVQRSVPDVDDGLTAVATD